MHGLPLQSGREFDSLKQYSGQLPLSDDEKDLMFFWLVTNTTNTQNKDKFILWLNGGPGCTSLDGVFMENGPYKFAGPNKLEFRDYSLSQQFDVLYVDQPFGTGFSTAPMDDYESSFKNATETLVGFFEKFYTVFPDYKTKQLYISGESEAGTYLPYLASAMIKREMSLGGVMIGNGWVDPRAMYMSYVDILREKELLTGDVQKKMLAAMDQCTKLYNKAPQPVHVNECEKIPEIFINEGGPSAEHCYNMYDLRLTDTQPSCGMNWPPEVHMYTDYLNRKDVQKALNVRDGAAPPTWSECNSQVNSVLRNDNSPPAVDLLPHILDKVPVLMFVGNEDFLCNHIGIEWMIGNLTWAGSQGFSKSAGFANWTVAKTLAGTVMADRGLTYARIFNASHMVGVDKPREMLDLFTAFTNASASNLQFESSFRSGHDKVTLPTVEPVRDSHALRWALIGMLLFTMLSFALCFLRRKQLFAWWHEHRGTQRLDDPMVTDRRLHDDELDEAFMMSEFTFKNQGRSSLDVEGLLLDDGAASSPDDDDDLADTVVTGPSSRHHQ
ncbi:Cell death protease [Linderina macrospora]|uniref:Cell death protease n=1 Tax=Linderina macrospora TaxID=4868 RepID=A0ACC1J8S1_9FUNG|nr:Cell death protease [Linderina macrospora]